jgi:hypothetical protein
MRIEVVVQMVCTSAITAAKAATPRRRSVRQGTAGRESRHLQL